MSGFWSTPFDFFKPPVDLAVQLRKSDFKTRLYVSMSNYWVSMYRLHHTQVSRTELETESIRITTDFHNSNLKVFANFKAKEDYAGMNPVEEAFQSLLKETHRMLFGNAYVSTEAFVKIQSLLTEVWESFWKIEAEDRQDFDCLMTKFSKNTWTTLGFDPKNAPVFGDGCPFPEPAAPWSPKSMDAEGHAVVTYLPLVVDKKILKAMIPGYVMNLEPIEGLGLKEDQHLLIIAIAEQTIVEPIRTTYREVYPIIPNISMQGAGVERFQAIPAIWASDLVVAAMAKQDSKLNKLFAKFEDAFTVASAATPTSTEILGKKVMSSVATDAGTFKDEPILTAKFRSPFPSSPELDNVQFQPYRKLLSQRWAYWSNQDIYTNDLRIYFSTAKIVGTTAELTLGKQYGMPKGNYAFMPLGPNHLLGAFTMEYDWTFYEEHRYPKLPVT